MTTMKEYDQWNDILDRVPRAECADDLNAIFDELNKLCENTAKVYPNSEYYTACLEICTRIEKAVTQWENIVEEVDEWDDWDFPEEWEDYGVYVHWGPDNIFKKDDNTVIIWDDLNGGYIECKRVIREA